MQIENSDLLRNVAVVGHNDTGKTTLVSAILHSSGIANRLNRPEDGNAVTDFDPEEIERGISINLAPAFGTWEGHKINLIDSPGYGIFMNEIRSAMRAADSTLLCIDALSGPQVTSERSWNFGERIGQPVAFLLTRSDRENADFERAVTAIQEAFNRNAMPVQIPIGSEGDFEGVVDLVSQKAFRYKRDGDGKAKAEEIPAELADMASEWHSRLVEAVAESDEELMEKYFEEGDLDAESLAAGLKKAFLTREVFPILISAAGHGIGTSALLDSIVTFFPSPTEVSYPASDIGGEEVALDSSHTAAVVIKTLSDPFTGKISILRIVQGELSATPLWNANTEEAEKVGSLMLMQGKTGTATSKAVAGDIVGIAKLKNTHTGDTLTSKDKPVRLGWIDPPVSAMSFAIEPRSKGDEEKIGDAILRLVEEDPSLRAGRDPQTGEYLLTGTSQLHVEIAVARLKNRYKVEVILHPPKVPYRETIKRAADGHGRHKKQSGGRGQFADCKIKMEPRESGAGFEFADEIFGGSIPQGYRPAVEKGIVEAAERGFLAGYPMVDFRVRLLDGQYHDVDSSEMAFKIAGSLAYKDAMTNAAPTILEPIMAVEINTTEEFMGDVMGDLSQRRGRPQGMDTKGNKQVVKATVPLAEMLDYATALRSMTQGRANFSMDFSHYDEVPRNIQERIIAEAQREQAEAS